MKQARWFAVLILLQVPSVAPAQTLEVSAGTAMPTGGFRATDRVGWLGMAALGGGSGASGFGGRLEALYGQNDRKAPNVGRTRLVGAMGTIVWQIPGSGGTIKPFVLLGAGGLRVRRDLSPSGRSSRTGFTLGAGAGLTFPVGPLNFVLEGRYLTLRGSGGHLNFFPLSAGLILRL
jgi:hypothetical protein